MAQPQPQVDWGTAQPIQSNQVDWGSATPIGGPASSPAGDWRDPLTRVEMHQPIHSASDLGREVVRGVGNIGAGGLGVLLRPVATAEGMGHALMHPLDTASEFADQAMAHPLETAESALGQGAVMGGAGKAVGKLAKIPGQFRPTSDPNIVPPVEQASRNLANVINTSPNRAPNFIEAAPHEVPNALDYAMRTKNPLNTQLEFHKAMEGSAQEALGHYQDNILGPNANEQIPAPQGFGGRSMPAGENTMNRATTLKDLNDRVVQLNKELNKPHAHLNESDTRAALASRADLEAEAKADTATLHNELAQRTGLKPEDIANLRQRAGRAYSMANDVDAAVTNRGLQEGKSTGSMPYPTTGGVLVKAFEKMRGGPTAIADRQFQRSIAKFPQSAPQPLPQPMYPQPRPALAGRPPTMPPAPQPYVPPVINTADLDAQAATRSRNLGIHENTKVAKAMESERNLDAQRRTAAGQAANRAVHGKTGGPSTSVPTPIVPPENPVINTQALSPRLLRLAKQKGLVP